MLEPESLYHNNLSYRLFFNPYINVAVYRYLEFLKESCEPSKPVLLYYIGILVVRKEYNTGECDPPPENLPEGVKKGLHHTVQAFDNLSVNSEDFLGVGRRFAAERIMAVKVSADSHRVCIQRFDFALAITQHMRPSAVIEAR